MKRDAGASLAPFPRWSVGTIKEFPVKHGHVTRAADCPYSSIHRYIEAGLLGRDWSGGICENDKRGDDEEK